MKGNCIFIMGVAGCGKTTVGRILAQRVNGMFLDGDDFHPVSNIRKMSSGYPLDDTDRGEWLAAINLKANALATEGITAVIACSALKKAYRSALRTGLRNTCFFFLEGRFEQIEKQLGERKDHFMPPGLLKSQFEVLEAPDAAENDCFTIPITAVEEEVALIQDRLQKFFITALNR